MTIVRLAACALACIAAPGCIVTPTIPHTPSASVCRGEIPDDEIARIVPGETTLDDVVLRFGEPDRVRDDGRVVAYVWDVAVGFWGFAVGAGGVAVVGGGDIAHYDGLLIRFDDAHRVVRTERTSQAMTKSDTGFFDSMERWE